MLKDLFIKDIQLDSVNDKRHLSVVIAKETPDIVILAVGDMGISVSRKELLQAIK